MYQTSSLAYKTPAPALTEVFQGKFSRVAHFIDLTAPGVTAGIDPYVMESVQDFSLGAFSQKNEKIMAYGSGNAVTILPEIEGEVSGTIKMLQGQVPLLLANIQRFTWGVGVDKYAAVNLGHLPTVPLIHVAATIRAFNNADVLAHLVIQEMRIKPVPGNLTPGTGTTDIPFFSEFDPVYLHADAMVMFDKFEGDGCQTAFTLSGTPVDLLDASASHLVSWDYDNAFFVKEKLAAAETGTRISTAEIVTNTLTFDTAPAVGTEISILYAIDRP